MTYDAGFYADGREMALSSARVVLAELAHWHKFDSVVDFGCGSNAWLDVAKEMGVTYTLGIDSTGTAPDIRDDVSQLIDLGQRFDLAISLEVGEHFEERLAPNLVSNLVRASDVVLFSAAIPGQPGVNHVNCQWQSWWAEKFEDEGYSVTADIRANLWVNPAVENFYRQNLLLCSVKHMESRLPLDVVHPDRVTPGWVGR